MVAGLGCSIVAGSTVVVGVVSYQCVPLGIVTFNRISCEVHDGEIWC